jgi:hypothetical protein
MQSHQVCSFFLWSPVGTCYADEHIGKLSPRAMITSKIRMEDVVEKGFKALIDEKDKHVKILVEVSHEKSHQTA